MEIKSTFGQTIRVLREKRNLPLREVANALNVDISMLGKIEKDTRRPTREFISNISRFFNIDEMELRKTFLSDTLAYQVLEEELDYVKEIFKAAEEKVKYIRNQRTKGR